jgi:hypothetical protein
LRNFGKTRWGWERGFLLSGPGKNFCIVEKNLPAPGKIFGKYFKKISGKYFALRKNFEKIFPEKFLRISSSFRLKEIREGHTPTSKIFHNPPYPSAKYFCEPPTPSPFSPTPAAASRRGSEPDPHGKKMMRGGTHHQIFFVTPSYPSAKYFQDHQSLPNPVPAGYTSISDFLNTSRCRRNQKVSSLPPSLMTCRIENFRSRKRSRLIEEPDGSSPLPGLMTGRIVKS